MAIRAKEMSKMLQQERFDSIMEMLKNNSAVKVSDLSNILKVSESTVRRDITDLAEAGKLKKVFGGAVSVKTSDIIGKEYDMRAKSDVNIEEKRRIAEYAASIINDNDFVFIDAGTTTGMMVDYLKNTNVTYVTNGYTHALKMAAKGLRTYVISGQMKSVTEAVVGAGAVESIKKYNFTKCFIGTNGIDTEEGFTTPDIEESMVKSEAINRSYMTFMLADHSKFGIVAPVTIAPLSSGCIITDRIDDVRYKDYTVVKAVDEEEEK